MMEQAGGFLGEIIIMPSGSPPPLRLTTPMDKWATILPLEVWKVVLGNLKGDPESLLNCSMTCQSWNELLEKEKVDLLFPMVIPLLLEKHYLSGNELLGCRLVSKMWKGQVDQFRQSVVQQWTPTFIDELTTTVRRLELLELAEGGGGVSGSSSSYQGRNVFTRTEQVRRFRRQMKNHPGNPFPAKSVIYQALSGGEDSAELVDFHDVLRIAAQMLMTARFGGFLTTCGLHLTDFTFISGNLLGGVPNLVDVFLQRLPNLTSFSLHHMHPNVIQLGKFEGPLPALPHLKSLTLNCEALDGVHWSHNSVERRREVMITKVFNALLVAYAPQLEQLEIDSEVLFAADYLDSIIAPKSEKLMFLQRLKIRNIGRTNNTFLHLDKKLTDLSLPNLQRVSLHFHPNASDGGKVELWRLVRLLDGWAETLVEAHFLVELPQLQIYSEFYSPEDSERQLEAIEAEVPLLKVFGACYSLLDSDLLLWFLKKFPKLERLELHGYKKDNNNNNNTAQGVTLPPRPPTTTSSSPKIRKTHQGILDSVWKEVATIKEIIVWGPAAVTEEEGSGKGLNKVFHRKRVAIVAKKKKRNVMK